MLNPSSKTPSHKFMMKYFGGFLAFAFMSKSPLPFNLAPWFWKQVIGEEVTMNDLEAIDAYSAQVLKDLQNYSQILSAEDFEMGVDQCFTTVLSSGEEVPLCEGGETRKVTKANVEEFCQAVLATRAAEAKEQVEAVREGFLRVIDNKSEILDFMSWSSFDARCTGDKTVDLERLKSITSFPRNDNNHRIVGRFWRVFESFNDQERTNYLKFVWGRQRLPVDLKNLSYKHEVRLESSMNNQSFPQAHTCFFQIDVPDYETDEDMRNKIKVACELCGEMDTDGAAGEDLD